MESLVFVANGLYLVSYFMNDMLRLRMLTVTAACCLVAYFYLRPEPMMTVICWNLFFVALNLFQIARLARQKWTRHEGPGTTSAPVNASA